MAFEKSGVEFIAKGLGSYLSDLNRANQAQQALGRSASGFTASFGNASGAIGGFGSKLSRLIPGIGGFGSALGNIAQIAGGIVVANVFGKMAEGVGAFVSTGIEAVGAAQQLEVGLGALLTQNNLYERTITQSTVAVGDFAKAQAEAGEKAKDLRLDIALQQATIQEQKERIRQVTAQWGENGLETIQQTARLAQMERELEKTTQELAGLSNIQQEYTTVTKTSFEQVREFGEAQALAAQQSQELLGFVDKLSIVSPFEQEQVALVTKFAVGAGLAVDEVKSFTSGFLDLAAAVGIGSENLAFASDQLLQVSKVGKITEIDLRQLRRLGIDLEKIISVEMGMSIEEFNAEAEKSPEIFNKLFNSVASFSEKTFGGAAQRMATTVAGLQSTLSDIFRVGAKNLLRPLVEAVGPVAADMLSRLSEVVTGPRLAEIGTDIGNRVAQGLVVIEGAINKIIGAFSRFGVRGAAVSILGMLGLDPTQIGGVMEAVDTITGAITTISTVLQQFGAQGAAVSILSILGLSPETIGLITVSVQTVITTVNDLATWWIATWPTIQAAALTGWEILKGVFAGFQNVVTVLSAQLAISFANITQGLNKMGLDWTDVWNAVKTATGLVAAGIGIILVGVVAAVGGVVTGIGAAVASMTATWSGLVDSMLIVTEGLATQFAGFINLFKALVAGDWAAAWESVKLIATGAVTTLRGVVQGIITLFTGAFGLILNTIGGFVTGVIAVFTGLYNTLIGHSIIPDLVNGIVKYFRELPQRIVSGLSNLISAVTKPFVDLAESIREEWEDAEWMELGVATIEGILEGLKKNADKIFEFLKELAKKAWDSVAGAIGLGSPATEFMPIGLSMVQGMIAGAQDADFAANFVDSLNMGTIARELGGGGSGWKEMRRIISQAIQNNMGLLASGDMGGMMAAIGNTAAQFGFPPSVAQSFAQMHGLLDGISERYQKLLLQMRVEGLATAISTATGLASIGTSFAEMVQSQMGDFQAAQAVYKEMTDSILKQQEKLVTEQGKLDNLNIDLAQAMERLDITDRKITLKEKLLADLKNELAAMEAAGEGASEGADKLRDRIEKEEIALDSLKVSYSEYQQQIDKTNTSIAIQADNVAELTAELEKQKEELKAQAFKTLTQGHAGIGPAASMAEQIAALEAFLGSGEATLAGKVWDDALHEWVNWSLDRNTAQIRLNELLAEQVALEEKIRKAQEQQQQLAFLQQQISLLKLIQDQGLNPADILGGITLGLNASVDDLLAATNAAVAAMIANINDTLQISSPSRVLEKIGTRVMQGFSLGVEKGGTLLDSAISGIPLLNMAMSPMAAPVVAGGGDTIYNGPFASINGVSINNGTDERAFYQKVERAVTRGMR